MYDADNGFISVSMNKAEITSRRLSVLMQLTPAIIQLILSPSIQKKTTGNGTDSVTLIISSHTSTETELMKQFLSMLSLSIQSLYGSKKGGLLVAKPGTNEAAQRNKAKTLFAEAAKEYAPLLLQVVSFLQQPIDTCRRHSSGVNSDETKPNEQSKLVLLNNQSPAKSDNERLRSDSTDKDWVDVDADAGSADATPPPLTSPSEITGKSRIEKPPPGRKCYNDLVSSQDIALYAVSRLVAQAMKYGGGEASTAVWRVIINSLPVDDTSFERKAYGVRKDDTEKSPSKQTLCHLIALVSA